MSSSPTTTTDGRLDHHGEPVPDHYKWVALSNTTLGMFMAMVDASIVIISSVSALQADYESAYGALKAALIHFVKGLARQQASKRIRANAVSPGMVYFKGGVWNALEVKNPARFQQLLACNPMGRMATPWDVANAVVFLSSPAASFITGISMVVDGGLTNRVNF